MRSLRIMAWLSNRLLFPLTAMTCLAGCGSRPPVAIFPVAGRLSVPEGLPVEKAILTWHCDTDPERLVSGVAGRDGNFELWTLVDSKRVRGAPAGRYRIDVTLPPGEGQGEPGQVVIDKTYLVAPGGGRFELVARRADDGG